MKYFLIKFCIPLLSLYFLDLFAPFLKINDGLAGLLFAALIFVLINEILKPILNLILLPVRIITLGTFNWVIGMILFFVWLTIAKNVAVSGWDVPSFSLGPVFVASFRLLWWQSAIVASIMLTLFIKILFWFVA